VVIMVMVEVRSWWRKGGRGFWGELGFILRKFGLCCGGGDGGFERVEKKLMCWW